MMASDMDGYTGQQLQDDLQTQPNPQDMGGPTILPPPPPPPQQTPPQSDLPPMPQRDPQSQQTIPNSAFAGAGVPQGVQDPTINQISQRALNPPQLPPRPSGWRQALGGVASMMGAGAVQPLIEYGPSGVRKIQEYNQWKGELPEIIHAGQMNTAQRRAEDSDENAVLKLQSQADLARERETGRAATAQATETGKAQSRKATLAQHGFEEDDKGAIVPLPYERMSQDQQAIHDLKAAQQEQAQATAALRKAQAENQPAAVALAQKRIDNSIEAHRIASQRLGLSEKQFEMRAHGTEGGEPLPGAMLGDQDQPIGTAFQQNVRPTGTERNKADLAKSAHEQIESMRSIIGKRPDVFGPLAGRKTDLDVWLGSQDPDAQRFLAARTLAADHAAGVFGGRSEAALHELNNALGKFKDNPAAALAGLEAFDKANATFAKAGTVKTAGSNAGGGNVGSIPGIGQTFNGQKVLKVEKIQ